MWTQIQNAFTGGITNHVCPFLCSWKDKTSTVMLTLHCNNFYCKSTPQLRVESLMNTSAITDIAVFLKQPTKNRSKMLFPEETAL